MECQIVPARKLEVNKAKKKNSKQKGNKFEEQTYDVFTLQPVFKPPKSTLDLEKSEDRSSKNSFYSEKKHSDHSKTNVGGFNHFTMSRPGALRTPETLPGNRDFGLQINKTQMVNFYRRPSNIQIPTNSASLASEGRRRPQYRRASSGEELILAASRRQSRRTSTRETLNGTCLYVGGGSKSLASSPRPQIVQDPQRRKSAGCKMSGVQDIKESDQQEQALRRKSLFDSHACTKWYSPERRPMSTERVEKTRANVISPRTLSRLYQTFRQQNGDEGVGGFQLSVCTEDDWKLYGSIFPNRKLVSHKQLNKEASLPYNDNIGLEETVTQDQARKMAKLQQYTEWKKQQKPSRQTPKQVWYRTVRSVLAVNQLYHKVQRRAAAQPLRERTSAHKIRA
ncbi:hypothetical protein ElyMa_002051300 [Elysia marginata]|uniref:Uncharacterized protein n=1 Tax=Elysia marginata TaxID=1093978 RepID=A0AAV4F8D9_9GAST|nr:hypothetical protein ElyMa_002051300 [Elysia marginata]